MLVAWLDLCLMLSYETMLSADKLISEVYTAESKGQGQDSTTQELEGFERTQAASQAEAQEAG